MAFGVWLEFKSLLMHVIYITNDRPDSIVPFELEFVWIQPFEE